MRNSFSKVIVLNFNNTCTVNGRLIDLEIYIDLIRKSQISFVRQST